MSAPVEHLTVEDALVLVEQINVGPVRDRGLIASAVMRPQASAFGADVYPGLAIKAAAMMHSIAHNHPLIEGNKLLALHLPMVFLRTNGYVCTLSNRQMVDLILDVAVGTADVQEISDRLQIAPA